MARPLLLRGALPRSPAIPTPTAFALAPSALDVDASRYAIVSVALVAGLVGMAWAFRRTFAGFWRSRAAARSLQVIDVLPLGGKRQLTVVRCYDRTFALGLGEREVSLIAELDPVVGERAPAGGAGAEPPAFDDLIERAQARLRGGPLPRGAAERREPFSEVLA